MHMTTCAEVMAQVEALLSLSDLAEPILLHVFRHLDGSELAKLCIQDRRLRQIAGEQSLWQTLALSRWTSCTPAHHAGDWQQLYRHRACLPNAFTSCVDRLHQLTTQAAGKQQLRMNSSSAGSPAGSPVKKNVYGFSQVPYARVPHMLLEKAMEDLFSLCTWTVSRSSRGSSSSSGSSEQAAVAAEMRLVKQDMAWWLSSKPEAVFQYVRRTYSMLDDWDMWGSGFSHWPEVVWRRSALQFVMDMHLGPEAGVCPSVTDRMERELDRLDGALRSVHAEGCELPTPKRPQGLPAKHWWYSLTGQLAGHCC